MAVKSHARRSFPVARSISFTAPITKTSQICRRLAPAVGLTFLITTDLAYWHTLNPHTPTAVGTAHIPVALMAFATSARITPRSPASGARWEQRIVIIARTVRSFSEQESKWICANHVAGSSAVAMEVAAILTAATITVSTAIMTSTSRRVRIACQGYPPNCLFFATTRWGGTIAGRAWQASTDADRGYRNLEQGEN
jgi:hypothetical protein